MLHNIQKIKTTKKDGYALGNNDTLLNQHSTLQILMIDLNITSWIYTIDMRKKKVAKYIFYRKK